MHRFKDFLFVCFLFFYAIANGQTSCGPTITQTQIVDASGIPNFDINIGGTVGSNVCSGVKVTLFCNNGFSSTQTVAVDLNTLSWLAKFADFNCPCMNGVAKFSVIAQCKDSIACSVKDKKTFEFICPGSGICPTINSVTPSIGPCKNDNATSCGYREVSFHAIVTGTPTIFEWFFGDGTPNFSGMGAVVDPPPHQYFKPPTLTPTLTIFTVGCNPLSVVFPINGVTFPICDACPINAQIVLNTTTSKCDLTGNVSANFCEEQYNSFTVDYGEGPTITETNLNLLNGYPLSHTYSSDGTYHLKITLQKNGSNCDYPKDITITGCKPHHDDDDSCFFCFCKDFWCCILYILFIIALIATIVSLAFALCNGGTAAWISFGISLAVAIGLAIWLIAVCDISICELLIALSIGGLINWAIVCGTNLIPCNSWLCQMSTIPILGIQVQNFLIVNLVIWILTVILCAV
jgi:hypothetical protein